MPRTPLIRAIGLILLPAAIAAGQMPAPVPPSDSLRSHVKGERFDIVTSIRGLPLGVRDELQVLWNSRSLDIAEPGADFQGAGTAVNPALPARRLVAAGCSADYHCLVYYERGGSSRSWLVALFRWTPAATRLEAAGAAPGGLKTIAEVHDAVVSGAIRRNDGW
jgi:hypothetical protein